MQKTSPATAHHVKHNLPTSVHVPGTPASTLGRAMYGETDMIEGTSGKLMKKVVASKVFHDC